MQNIIYKYAPYAFGTSLLLWLIGGPFHVAALLTITSWLGVISSFIWCWNVILDSSLSTQDRVLMNLIPLIWFIASWAYLVGLLRVA